MEIDDISLIVPCDSMYNNIMDDRHKYRTHCIKRKLSIDKIFG